MKLFILRHGEAELRAESDRDRNLTERGRVQVAQIVEKNSKVLSEVKKIWVSPYVRAQQTADIVCSFFSGVERETCDQITPDGNIQSVLEWLSQNHTQADLFVSHQPFVSSLVDSFCAKPRGYSSMGTSALAAIEYEVAATGCGELLWIQHPS